MGSDAGGVYGVSVDFLEINHTVNQSFKKAEVGILDSNFRFLE